MNIREFLYSVNEFMDNFHTLQGPAPLCKLCECHNYFQELALFCEEINEIFFWKGTLETGMTYHDIYEGFFVITTKCVKFFLHNYFNFLFLENQFKTPL